MRLTPKEIDCSEGFTNQNDIFRRENFAIQLENIITNAEDESLVFGIDDNWGNGKTTFLRLWEGRLNNNSTSKLQMIYFDAFEHDYQQDAFLALASKIYSLIDEENHPLKKKFITTAKVVGKNLFSIATKVGIKVATSGLVDGSIIENSADTISDSLTDPLDKFIEDKIKGAKRDEESIIHFKNILEKIAVDKRIIFVIDELDRARPDFSLEILEKIKHVFSAKNFIFVLSMNRDQFEKSITNRYGEIDASLYLSKFITHWFTLPKEPETKFNKSSISKYCEHLYLTIFNCNKEYETIYEVLSILLKRNDCSLREAEKAFGIAALILASFKAKPLEASQAAIGLVVFLNIFYQKKLSEIINGKLTTETIFKLLGVDLSSQDYSEKLIIKIVNTEHLSAAEYDIKVKEKSELILNPMIDRPRFIEEMYKHINRMFVENN